MKKKTKMLLIAIIGFCMYAGFTILNAVTEVNTLLTICLSILRYSGLLAAILGINYFGTRYIWERNPEISQDELVNLSDERLISIRNKAKAKTFDIMIYVLILLAVLYADLKAGLLVISLVAVSGIIMAGCYYYYKNKYTKEM